MNAVDWSQAPEGAIAFQRMKNYLMCYWIVFSDSESFVHVGATMQDVAHGLHTRPSAAEAELRARVSRLEETCDELRAEVVLYKNECERLNGAVASPAPDGWKLVPLTPTQAMLDGGVHAGVHATPDPWCPKVWDAMVVLAPSPGQSASSEMLRQGGI